MLESLRDLAAHGIGGARDLPIPATYAIVGATAALVISFTILVLAWRQPRLEPSQRPGRVVPGWLRAAVDSAAFAWSLRLLGLAVFAVVAVAAIFGPDTQVNPVFGFVYVLLWNGLVFAALLFGNVYRALNPIRTLHLLVSRLTRISPSEGLLRLPSWVGMWPAAAGLFAFVWLELVWPERGYLSSIRIWFALYFVIVFVGAAVFGDRWIRAADPFEAFSRLVGRLSVWGRNADGELVWRHPLSNLASLRPEPGFVTAIAVLLGSTAFDSFAATQLWVRVINDGRFEAWGLSFAMPQDDVVSGTLGLLGLIGLVLLSYTAACWATGVDQRAQRRQLPGLLAHALVPIVVGYVVAHYLSQFVSRGSQTVAQLSDPLVRGDNWFGTADFARIDWLAQNPTLLAGLKVGAVVIGHVLAVVSSHDRAIGLLPRAHQLTGQLALLVVMVGYTAGGLFLLLNA